MITETFRYVVAVNDQGRRIGEYHPKAKLTDNDVELIRQLRDDGMRYRTIAEKFEVKPRTIGNICRYESRAQTIFKFKPISQKGSADMPKNKTTLAEPRPKGRPLAYTPELADQICDRVSLGESMTLICSDDKLPCRSTVHMWIADDVSGFRARYSYAKQIALLEMAEEILHIADTPVESVKREDRSDGSFKEVREDAVDRSRLRVTTRQWLLTKLAPKKFGDAHRMELTGADGGPVELTDTERTAKLTAIFAQAQARLDGVDADVSV